MNKLLVFIMLIAALPFACPPPSDAQSAPKVSVEYFYTSLAPYGEWLDVENYGYCWHPTVVDPGWRPYTVGRWVYTDAGWAWDSDEPFGWIVFHYGRWTNLADIGWCWVPDTTWAPAWVSFRHSDEYAGWAPLPPEARFWVSIGFNNWVDAYYDIGPASYCFVPARRFCAPLARAVILQPGHNLGCYAATANVTRYSERGNIIFVGGPRYEVIAARSEWPVKRMKLEREEDVDPSVVGMEKMRSKIESDRLIIPRLKISTAAAVHPPKVARQLHAAKVNRGWERTGDPGPAMELRAKTRRESPPPTALPPEPKYDKVLNEPPKATVAPQHTVSRAKRSPDAPPVSTHQKKLDALPEVGTSPAPFNPPSKSKKPDVPLIVPNPEQRSHAPPAEPILSQPKLKPPEAPIFAPGERGHLQVLPQEMKKKHPKDGKKPDGKLPSEPGLSATPRAQAIAPPPGFIPRPGGDRLDRPGRHEQPRIAPVPGRPETTPQGGAKAPPGEKHKKKPKKPDSEGEPTPKS